MGSHPRRLCIASATLPPLVKPPPVPLALDEALGVAFFGVGGFFGVGDGATTIGGLLPAGALLARGVFSTVLSTVFSTVASTVASNGASSVASSSPAPLVAAFAANDRTWLHQLHLLTYGCIG